MSADASPPVLEFPCSYPIKVLGVANEVFTEQVLAVFSQHAAGFDRDQVRILPSTKGSFVSVHVVIEAQGAEHIEVIYQALNLKLVL
jgi:putative lipoic acid-binding regulatory protein